jgi:hypothetical protein
MDLCPEIHGHGPRPALLFTVSEPVQEESENHQDLCPGPATLRDLRILPGDNVFTRWVTFGNTSCLFDFPISDIAHDENALKDTFNETTFVAG